MSNRILDTPSVEKLSTLVAIAKENNLAISIDFIGRPKAGKLENDIWIIQMYDCEERLVVSANSSNPVIAIRNVYENWLAKTAPKI